MKVKTSKKSITHWWDLTLAERDEAVKEFDKPIPRSRLRPLSAKQRALWEAWQANKPDVSIFVTCDNGVRYEIHLDDELMDRTMAYARQKKITVAQIIEKGVRGVLAFGD